MILRLEGETSLEKVLANPQRRSPLAHDRRDVPIDRTIAVIAADDPRDLACARAALLPFLKAHDTVRTAWLTISLSEIAAPIAGGPARLRVTDLRGNCEATYAYFMGQEAVSTDLANSLIDHSVAAVFLSHPVLATAWIALLKPAAIQTLATHEVLDLKLGQRDFPSHELFARRSALNHLQRVNRHLLKWTSGLITLLGTVGTITVSLHILGIL